MTINITPELISRSYPPRLNMQPGVVYVNNEEFRAKYRCPTNPMEAAIQDQMDVSDVTCTVGRTSIAGYGYTHSPQEYLWMKHYLQGRPVHPLSFELEFWPEA